MIIIWQRFGNIKIELSSARYVVLKNKITVSVFVCSITPMTYFQSSSRFNLYTANA